jgi:hypothetical protein
VRYILAAVISRTALLYFHCCYQSQTDCADPLNSMYYMVIVQYTARLNPKKLLQTISTLKPECERPPRKRYHFTLAPEQVQVASYNGVLLTFCVCSIAQFALEVLLLSYAVVVLLFLDIATRAAACHE